MKNKKIVFVFILIIALLLVMTSCVKASSGLNVLEGGSGLPSLADPNGNNETEPAGNNEQKGNNEIKGNNQTENTLPKTGVEENTTVFVFIAVCIASAVYAYVKIRKYNNVH